MSANEDYDREAGLKLLSEEERAAISDDGLTDAEKEAMQEIVGEGGEEVEKEEESGDDETDAAAEGEPGDDEAGTEDKDKPADTEAAADAEAAAVDTAEDEDEEITPRRAVYQASLPDDFDEQVGALDTAAAELTSKLKAGDIDADEFLRENQRITKARGELDRMRNKAEIAQEMNEQAAQQEWEDNVTRFMRQVKKDEGVDYVGDPTKLSDFDSIVKALAAKPENLDKSFKWFLSQAHKATKALHGIADKAPVARDGKDDKPAKPAARKPSVQGLPQTLAHVPGGEGPGDVGDEFTDLDNLTGDAYETALAKLSPAQRERYLVTA